MPEKNNSPPLCAIYHQFYAAPYRQPKCNLTGDSFSKLKLVIGRLPSLDPGGVLYCTGPVLHSIPAIDLNMTTTPPPMLR